MFVEVVYLFLWDDIDGVDGMGLCEFFVCIGIIFDFVVYKDFCDCGFYFLFVCEGWFGVVDVVDVDFFVYFCGKGLWDGEVEYWVCVVGECESIFVLLFGEVVFVIVDEDGDLMYFDIEGDDFEGMVVEDFLVDFDVEFFLDCVFVWDGVDCFY